MNIWVIGRSYPIKQNKMRGSFELEQAQLLAKGNNKVTYIAVIFHPINKVKKWGFCSFKDGQVNVYVESIPFTPERMHIHLSKLQGNVWRRLFRKIEFEQGIPDIIHVHYPGMVSIPDPVLEYKKKGTRIVTTEHWSRTLTDSMDSFQRKQLIEYTDKADSILCVGQPLKESIQKITGTRKDIVVVPNVVSSFFMPAWHNKNEIFEYIVVGRLVPVKQMDKIAEAFCAVFSDISNVKLTIVGGGKEERTIQKIIYENKMQNRILLTGTLSREETAKRVANADALICYSKFETFGVPVIEAWACGIPVIASDSLGFLEYWDDRLGQIVQWDNIDTLKDAMRKMCLERNKYNKEWIARFAQENFGEDAIRNKLMEIYKR